jgi:hypothetical protein
MVEHEQWQLAMIIVDFTSKTTMVCSRPKSRKLVMEKKKSHFKVCDDLRIIFCL